ncbi:hypothetical protein [Kitasatospora sp. NPDC048407]|uniref:hypothetical protein n=1 Tax=Kitasatospora sp. NPDC048407 TaxID=3364051 RepID=UPI00372351E4
MNLAELLADLRTRQDEATARATELRARIEELAADLAEAEMRLTDLATARKIIAEITPAGTEPEPPETNTTYQAIVNAFNQHPDQEFRARELHELLGMPTDEASVNITRSRLGRLTRQGFLTQPGRGRYQKRT